MWWLPGAHACAQYLPCFAVAGNQLQFYAIPQGSPHEPVAITPVVFLADPLRRAELALYCVKVWRPYVVLLFLGWFCEAAIPSLRVTPPLADACSSTSC